MRKSWSKSAEAAWKNYPWASAADAARAREESELVAFGAQVEVDDLPLAVRQWLRRQRRVHAPWRWHGESWEKLVARFEKSVFSQVLAASHGNVAAAARALKTTPRIVAYKSRKYGLI